MLTSRWILPVCESLHFIGMAMLMGVAAIIDLRILGMARRLPIAPLQRLTPWAVAGFVLSLASGAVFIASNPQQYVGPPLSLSFVVKLLFVALACLNAGFFYVSGLKRAVDGVEAGGDAPASAKINAAVSLLLWIGVMYWGRILQFFGKAF